MQLPCAVARKYWLTLTQERVSVFATWVNVLKQAPHRSEGTENLKFCVLIMTTQSLPDFERNANGP
jgi:hypothetical protein